VAFKFIKSFRDATLSFDSLPGDDVRTGPPQKCRINCPRLDVGVAAPGQFELREHFLPAIGTWARIDNRIGQVALSGVIPFQVIVNIH
jgi:hypothetical protein